MNLDILGAPGARVPEDGAVDGNGARLPAATSAKYKHQQMLFLIGQRGAVKPVDWLKIALLVTNEAYRTQPFHYFANFLFWREID